MVTRFRENCVAVTWSTRPGIELSPQLRSLSCRNSWDYGSDHLLGVQVFSPPPLLALIISTLIPFLVPYTITTVGVCPLGGPGCFLHSLIGKIRSNSEDMSLLGLVFAPFSRWIGQEYMCQGYALNIYLFHLANVVIWRRCFMLSVLLFFPSNNYLSSGLFVFISSSSPSFPFSPFWSLLPLSPRA